MMRIGIVNRNFSPQRGGAEGYLANLTYELRYHGHDVTVFAANVTREFEDEYRIVKIPPCRIRQFRDIHFARLAETEFRKHDLDITFGVGKATGVDVLRPGGGTELAWQKADLESTRDGFERLSVKIRRAFSVKHRIGLKIEERQYAPDGVRLVVANSTRVFKDLVHLRGIRQERIRIVHNGVDLNRFSPHELDRSRKQFRTELGIGADESAIAFAATNFRLKGLAFLLKALAENGLSHKVLVIGSDHAPFRHYFGYPRDRVLMLGRRPDVERCYAACDCMVHPTFYDPFANACLEAMAMGLPVVTTRANGMCEIIDHGVDGFVIDNPRDTGSLAGIIRTLADREFRLAVGAAARAKAEQFPLTRNFEEMMAVFKEALQMKKGAAVLGE